MGTGAKRFNVGSCWSEPDAEGMIEAVVCSDSPALFEVSQVALDEMKCTTNSQGSVKTDDGRVAGSRLLQ